MTEAAQKPKNEQERLAELRRYAILDTLPESAFDDLTKIASSICNTPISMVSLIDSDRQWFKSTSGISGVTETPRDIAFCAHAILDSHTMVIKDSHKDPRFSENPLVTGEMNVRFYAGAPLVTPNGFNIGTLCTIDNKPRDLSEEQILTLEALARQVVDQLELRVHISRLEEQAKELHKNRENSLRKILETMQSGLMVIDENGQLERTNPSLEQMLGYSTEELTGLDSDKILVDSQFINNKKDINLEPIPVRHTETALKSKDGKLVPVLLSASAIINGDNKFISWVCVAHDLTTTKAIQAQLLSAQKLEAIGRLAAGISHEINTPIQFIGDNTRFLLDAFKDYAKAVNFLKDLVDNKECHNLSIDNVQTNARQLLESLDFEFLCEETPKAIDQTLDGVNRVSRIVRAMKEFSHPGSDQKQMVNLNRLIESTITVSANEWKYIANIETNLDSGLPLVPCFAGELNQVILNIIVNAAHALESSAARETKDKGIISIGSKLQEEHAVIWIKDNGHGISPEIINKIFDPFFTTKEVGKGTGQGLAIAHSVVVDKHSGRIDVESNVGEGTTFRIYLPIRVSNITNIQPSKGNLTGVSI